MKEKALKCICITVLGAAVLLGTVVFTPDIIPAETIKASNTGTNKVSKAGTDTVSKTELKTVPKAGAKAAITAYSDIIGEETGKEDEAFTADDLKKYLENEGKNGKNGGQKGTGTGNAAHEIESKEERWKKFMELSLNGVVSENGAVSDNGTGTEIGNGTGNEKESGDERDDSEKVTDEEETIDHYIPPKGEEWKLLLVNKQNPIPDDYDAKLVNINGSARIREELALPLAEMFDAAAKEGVTLTVCSAYRSHEHQQELFDRKIKGYTGQGLSYLDAFRIGSYSVIIPGTSEHELGMALDIITPGYTQLNEGFADTRAGEWLAENAYKYGFILRYPEGKEYITGIIFEPWHFRYVGKEAAEDIFKSGLTLEEYLREIGWE